MSEIKRRDFIKTTSTAAVTTAALGTSVFSSPLGANDRINIAVVGVRSRGRAHTKAASHTDKLKVSHVCDVDQEILRGHLDYCSEEIGYSPETETDFRRLLENKDVDAITIATPEHWHAPMAIMAMQAGKHVYLEKPCSHNAWETELLVRVQRKYGRVCQMGNQQRSSVTSSMAIKDIKAGIIGKAYMGKAWYSNTRDTIGKGKVVPVPEYLDWDLWQGPAPREDYRDNVHPYNWHWFRTWGTGELHNNGTHEIDICRWALGVDYPTRVVSAGGRLHFTDDDWEFYDTQMVSYEFGGGKTITWEGRSCNGLKHHDRGRGCTIHGTKGSILLDRAGYILYDPDGKVIKHLKENDPGTSTSTKDTTGWDTLTVSHMQNFSDAILKGEKLNAPIDDASISTQLCHLGNIAQDVRRSLSVDPANGHILEDSEADGSWRRTYENGWEPTL